MTAMEKPVNSAGGIAQIRNVMLCYDAITRTQDRHALLPGLAVFYGRSGEGKTLAATHMALKLRAYYLQVKSTWTKKDFMEALLLEMSIKPASTTSAMAKQAATELARSNRPLIVDEFDYMVTDGKLELVRDLYESSQGTILLVGEEGLPSKLEKWERFHGRVLNWVPAMPVDLGDAKCLMAVYSPAVVWSDELLQELVIAVRGSCRRACNNLQLLSQQALESNVRQLDAGSFKRLGLQFVTGESPKPRKY